MTYLDIQLALANTIKKEYGFDVIIRIENSLLDWNKTYVRLVFKKDKLTIDFCLVYDSRYDFAQYFFMISAFPTQILDQLLITKKGKLKKKRKSLVSALDVLLNDTYFKIDNWNDDELVITAFNDSDIDITKYLPLRNAIPLNVNGTDSQIFSFFKRKDKLCTAHISAMQK